MFFTGFSTSAFSALAGGPAAARSMTANAQSSVPSGIGWDATQADPGGIGWDATQADPGGIGWDGALAPGSVAL